MIILKKFYNKIYETNNYNNYLDLCYDYSELSLGFQWLMKARCGYKFDASVAKAAKLVTEDCPNFCPCCFSGKQNIEH